MDALNIILMVILTLISILVITVILFQPGTSGGLSGAIVGGGAADTFYGKNKSRSTTGRLVMATKISIGILFVFSLGIVVLSKYL